MSNAPRTPGRFVWHELFTDSIEASMLFYDGLCGWRFAINEIGDPEYRLVLVNDNPIGRLLPLSTTAAQEVPAHWLPYVSVPNVDLAAHAAIKGGGSILGAPRDIDPVGRFAVVQDPGGARLALWRSAVGDPPESAPTVGTFCWNQLNTPEPDDAGPFYQKVFTWHRAAANSSDQQWIFARDEREQAGLVATAAGTNAHWLSHLVVTDLDRARRLTPDLGGQVLVDEILVPELGRFAVIEDNVGARLALFEG